MKLLHISDLHIGKRIYEFSMLEDQKYILNQILEIADAEQAEGIIIAGDIYDKPVPSGEAVQVFDSFLTELAARGKKVFIVSGNHDSAERLAFGARLMDGRGVYVSPVYDGRAMKVEMRDEYGEIFLHLLPFIKPAMMRCVLGKEDTKPAMMRDAPGKEESARLPESYQDALELALARMEIDSTKRNILVAHQFVTGAGRCESEEASVGGLDNVDAEIFDGFDYVALGHIHSPQWVRRRQVRYCGTPLKYSFSEAEQEKSVTVLTLKEKGCVEIGTAPLKALRDMRRLRGSYEEVMARSFYRELGRQDYVQITLTDEEDIPDGFARLRTVYPNLMRLAYDNSRTSVNREIEPPEDGEQKSELELFGEFYELQNNRPMSGEQQEVVRQMLEDIKSDSSAYKKV